MQLSVAAGSGSAAAADELAFCWETTSQSRLRATCNGVSGKSVLTIETEPTLVVEMDRFPICNP